MEAYRYDEEFDKAIEDLVEEEVRHYEAIIVRVGV